MFLWVEMMDFQNSQLLAKISLRYLSAQVSNAGNIICNNYVPDLALQNHNDVIYSLEQLW